MRNRYAMLIVPVLILGVVAGIVIRDATKQKPQAVKIGALLALTGSGANYGKSLRQGIEMAKEEINQNGGINGRPLEIIYEDSQGDAKTGVSAFNKLLAVDKVPLVIGSISSVILAVAPVADRKHVVLINSSAISPKIAERATDFLFSIMVSGAQEARFMARDFAEKKRNSAIAVLYSNNSSGIDTKDIFIKYLVDSGGRLAVEQGYELNSTDFRAQLSKIQASGATDCYLIAFSSREFARVLTQSNELGLSMHWYSYSGFETKETLDFAGPSAEGVIYTYPDYLGQKDRMGAFQKRYAEKYGDWADIYTVTSYDGMHMIAKVMMKEGTDSEQIRLGLRKTGAYSGVFGEIKFEGKQYVNKPLIWKTVKNGKYVLLPTQ